MAITVMMRLSTDGRNCNEKSGVVENIFLATTAEGLGCSMRIPVGEEGKMVCQEIGVPENYVMSCYIGIGVPAKGSPILE